MLIGGSVSLHLCLPRDKWVLKHRNRMSQNGSLVSGQVDEHRRSSGPEVLSHTQIQAVTRPPCMDSSTRTAGNRWIRWAQVGPGASTCGRGPAQPQALRRAGSRGSAGKRITKGSQVLVHATFQGNPFWGYPLFLTAAMWL